MLKKAEHAAYLVKKHRLQEVDDGGFVMQLRGENSRRQLVGGGNGAWALSLQSSCCGQKASWTGCPESEIL